MCDKCDFRSFRTAEIDRHVRQSHLGIFAYNCHICHRAEVRIGFSTRKRFHRHLRAQHGVDNPEEEDNEQNKELIKNPKPLLNFIEPDKKNMLSVRMKMMSEIRKKTGIVIKRKPNLKRKRKPKNPIHGKTQDQLFETKIIIGSRKITIS